MILSSKGSSAGNTRRPPVRAGYASGKKQYKENEIPGRVWKETRKRRWCARHSKRVKSEGLLSLQVGTYGGLSSYTDGTWALLDKEGREVSRSIGPKPKTCDPQEKGKLGGGNYHCLNPFDNLVLYRTVDDSYETGIEGFDSSITREWDYALELNYSVKTRMEIAARAVEESFLLLSSRLPKLSPSKSETPNKCGNRKSLARLVTECCRMISRSFNEDYDRKQILQPVTCGTLRNHIRDRFRPDLPVEVELSIKTASKLERRWCTACQAQLGQSILQDWKKARLEPVEVDSEHLAKFQKSFSLNISEGWNKRNYPYVPNGSATFEHSRRAGGNWNEGQFSQDCEAKLVISSGKPRIVTLYSEYNTRVLTPLHHSLYDSLKKWGWLLVGDPHDELLQKMKGTGPWISIDYQSATDKIKLPYVRAAILELEKKANPPLSVEQSRCLRVLGELMVDGKPACTGQPMGSVMSFPLLCIINKTINDMALQELLSQGIITYNVYRSHACLINGDDCLTREPITRGLYRPGSLSTRSPGPLLSRLIKHGSAVGLKVNLEKTMVSYDLAEINSTLFRACRRVPKVNLSALRMKPDVEQVIQYAQRSVIDTPGLVTVLKRNCHILAKQSRKEFYRLSTDQRKSVLKKKSIKRALRSFPITRREQPINPFPVVPRPDGYDLDHEEEVKIINDEVSRLRQISFRPQKGKKQKILTKENSDPHCFYYEKPERSSEDTVLKVLAKAFNERRWGDACSADETSSLGSCLVDRIVYERVFSGESIIGALVGAIRETKGRRVVPQAPETIDQIVSSFYKPDWIALG